jgi:hypothetical protein
MSEFFVERQGKRFGPFDSARLRQLARDKKIRGDDLIVQGSRKALASTVKGLLDSQPPRATSRTALSFTLSAIGRGMGEFKGDTCDRW